MKFLNINDKFPAVDSPEFKGIFPDGEASTNRGIPDLGGRDQADIDGVVGCPSDDIAREIAEASIEIERLAAVDIQILQRLSVPVKLVVEFASVSVGRF